MIWKIRKRIEPFMPGLVIGGLIAGGTIIYVFRLIITDNAPWEVIKFSQNWWIVIAGDLAQLCIIGGVIGGVMRFMATAGFFRQALEDIVISDSYLDRRKDLNDLWYRLTSRIYLGGYITDGTNDQNFSERLLVRIRAYMEYNKPFFLRDVARKLTLKWHDETRRFIELQYEVFFTLVPFNPDEPVGYETEFVPGEGLSTSDYEFVSAKLRYGSAKGQELEDEVVLKGTNKIRKATLAGRREYKLWKCEVRRWCLDNDPLWHIESPYVVDNLTLNVDCQCADLATTFGAAGGGDELYQHTLSNERRAQAPGDIRVGYKGILLPGQGQILVFRPRGGASESASAAPSH